MKRSVSVLSLILLIALILTSCASTPATTAPTSAPKPAAPAVTAAPAAPAATKAPAAPAAPAATTAPAAPAATKAPAAATGETIKIGALLDFTGPVADLGPKFKAGIELALRGGQLHDRRPQGGAVGRR